MSTPVLSVYVPVYNVEKHLEQCLESILGQTFSDFELYIYNDGSTDNSFAICQKFAERDSRIILQTGENGNYVHVMNKFIETARGQYIGFVDSDDYLDKDYFRKIMEALLNTDADSAIASFTLVDHEGRKLPWYTPKFKDGEILTREQVLRKFLTTLEIEGYRWNKFHRRSLFTENGVRFENTNPEDIMGQIGALSNLKKMVTVDSHGYYYRQLASSLASTPSSRKVMNFLKIFRDVSEIFKGYGMETEAEYYRVWRSVNVLFFAWKDRKNYPAEEWKKLHDQCNWHTAIKVPLFRALRTVWKYKNEKDGFLKFSIKTVIVWYAFR